MSRFSTLAARAANTVARHYGDPIVAYDPPERLAANASPIGVLQSVTVYRGELDYAQMPEQAWRLDVLCSDFATTPQRGDRLTLRANDEADTLFVVDGLLKNSDGGDDGSDGTVMRLHLREDLTPP